MLDGAHPWGFFDATAGRYGLRRYRLVVFPPGISAADRRLLRLWRGWPVGGGFLAMLAVMVLGGSTASAATTLFVAIASYVGLGTVLFVLTSNARHNVRSMSLIFLAGDLQPRDRQSFAEWERLVDLLTGADSMLKMDAIDFTQHEARWWQAYDQLEEHTRV
jgi:hypothetical protein